MCLSKIALVTLFEFQLWFSLVAENVTCIRMRLKVGIDRSAHVMSAGSQADV